ncbi:selenophosphate synthetase [Methanocaldococcus villosus KIN24-T80]|uniref:Selenophosphate synthetase n=1 Tax=Methanocaldococcus villosus KIN24-T80 TaxID=1069083 RepID=N6VRV4_9EURY|nr:selenophosphate synthetase [Methanocaldococcus villosus KIN24-T80]
MVVGLGDDAAVIKRGDILIAKTVDVFTPIVDDPYIQGKIAACNSTSDIYAMGFLDIIGVLCIIGFPEKFPIEISKEMLRGFQDFCRENKTSIVGGHTIINPWPLIGGAVTGVGKEEELLTKAGAKEGDLLILTKPLGTQTAMALSRVPDEFKEFIGLSEEEIKEIIDKAIELMTTSNRYALMALRKAEERVGDRIANALTDVTGFGILGHSNEIAKFSKKLIEIKALPCIKKTPELSKMFGHPLLEGYGAETAGGLLISAKKEYKDDLIDELEKVGYAFEVGEVKRGEGKAVLKNPKIIEV